MSWLTLLGLLVHVLGAPRRTAPSAHWATFAGLLICLAASALLTSGRTLRFVESQPDGPWRDRAAVLANASDVVARRVGLDRPALLVDQALGRPVPATVGPGPRAVLPRSPDGPRPGPDLGVTPGAPTPPPAPTPDASRATPRASALGPETATPAAAAQAAPAPPEAGPGPDPADAPPDPGAAPADAPAHRPITPEAPLRVHVAGDSVAEWLGSEMARYGVTSHFLTSDLDFHLSSGLLTPARLNWPVQLSQTMSESPPPDVVVLFLGANDFDNIRLDGRTLTMQTPAWQAEYTRRAGELMDVVGSGGARLYWVGMPVLRDARRNATAADANAAVTEAASTRPWVRVVDIWTLFADPQGRFATFHPGPDGEVTRVRQDDGIHLTRPATNWVAALVYDAIREDWDLP